MVGVPNNNCWIEGSLKSLAIVERAENKGFYRELYGAVYQNNVFRKRARKGLGRNKKMEYKTKCVIIKL